MLLLLFLSVQRLTACCGDVCCAVINQLKGKNHEEYWIYQGI